MMELLQPGVRLLSYLLLMLLFGWPLFSAYWRLGAGALPASTRWAMPSIAVAALALVVMEAGLRLANLLATRLPLLDADSVRWFLFELPAGRAALVRMASLVLLLGLLAGAGKAQSSRRPSAVLAAAVALSSLAWNGHAAAADGWRLAGGILHLLAAGAWVGAITLLLMLAWKSRAAVAPQVDTLRAALRGFATPGTLIVSLLVLSGGFSYLSLGGTWAGLWASRYGQLLLLKLCLVGGMLLLAALHRRWLVPMLDATARQPAGAKVLRHLRGSLALDALFALLVVACVAVLGTLDPAA